MTVIATAVAIVAVGLLVTDRGLRDPRRMGLVAALVAAAVAGRVLFVAVPSVQPVTVIVVATGAVLGSRAGFAVGALTALVSNVALGQGPWTPGQMALWGLAGVAGALAARVCRRPPGLAAVTFAIAWVYGWGMNLWSLATFGPEVSWDAFAAKASLSIWFETAHAVGNVLIALAIGGALIRLLDRYRGRVATEIDWALPPLETSLADGPIASPSTPSSPGAV
jgi:energy-coupling factor transport system substrate-specific component